MFPFDEGFFFLDKGSIGEIRGFRKIPIDPHTQQSLLDSNTRERLNMFDPPPGLSSADYSTLFAQSFMKARSDIQEQELNVVQFSVTIQVGNAESLQEISIIENNSLFSRWENPDFMKQFKELSNIYLSE